MTISTDNVEAEFQFACSCLNVRIRAPKPNASTKASPKDNSPEYMSIHTTEKNISMTHSALTLRFRTRGSAVSPQTWGQYITLRCLVCDLVVYRVYQEVPTSMAAREGPIRPREDWIEDEVLFSSTGWIEVSEKCLSGQDLKRQETSGQVSSLYQIVMPSSPDAPQAPHPTLDPPVPTQYFAHMPPLIASTPFTPNHIVFGRISEVAQEKSDRIRLDAEKEIVEIIQQKSREILQKETALRVEVHTLWVRYRENMQKILAAQREAIVPRSPISPGGDGLRNIDAATSVKNFTPSKVSPRNIVAASPAPRMSSLSASLATSTFHHPKANEPERSPSPSTSNAASSPSDTPSTVEPSLLSYKRVKDETSDAATSYRYWVNMEEEMARHKGRQQETQDRVTTILEGREPSAPKSVTVQTTSAMNGRGSSKTEAAQPPEESKPDTPTKGKRKVTFEVSEGSPEADSQATAPSKPEEGDDMMFPIEEDDESRDPTSSEATRLPFLDQPSQLPRSGRNYPRRNFDTTGLPASFSGLRPTSLPVISQVRKPPSVRNTLASLVLPPLDAAPEDEERELSVQDGDIMRLVAAGTPGHRAAWKKHGPAWKKFMQKPANDSEETDTDSEEMDRIGELQGRWRSEFVDVVETEPDLANAGIPGSLAIPLHDRPKPKERTEEDTLMASYRAPATLQGQEPQGPASVKTTLDTVREVPQAPSTSLLPTPTVANNDEEDVPSADDIERSKKHALKILEARNKIPEAGMWSSLA